MQHKNLVTAIFCLVFTVLSGFAQDTLDVARQLDSLENSFTYQTGKISLPQGEADLSVPSGFKYLDPKQAQFVLSKLWGNPEDTSVLGMLIPENIGVLAPSSWAFTISYDPMGYVKDDDAAEIDYDDLLKEQQKDAKESNKIRVEQGYEPVEFVQWAATPYYDGKQKTLHWAKELKFGSDSSHTLNYNLRVLGRKGIFLLNAVAPMDALPEVKQHVATVINSVAFREGSRYSDYSPGVDEVAAWTVGGLVAGKVLAKVGFFALLLKFWKLIAVGVAGLGSAAWKFFSGRRKSTEEAPEA
ncbi:DUF2167 domain-containing protein [Flavihumibacter petaseus]|uniref:DUF2167 domain-containing protein n=1 Tax=Flavihumibacter petaseus NBRC 106054 TaxID=1220578 RepID=A0A0E9N5I3_9BACT|nr:DUF2167 domain-containing protein [Flavihumibacter petaseus]GAO44941.1 hypothetical protein FPE01S_04_01840 [Flavihumibacter petaseus NBRC 106054]